MSQYGEYTPQPNQPERESQVRKHFEVPDDQKIRDFIRMANDLVSQLNASAEIPTAYDIYRAIDFLTRAYAVAQATESGDAGSASAEDAT